MWLIYKFKGYIAAAGLAIGILVAAYTKGRIAQKQKDEANDDKEYKETRDNIDRAQVAASGDPSDWLRERANKRDL